MKGKHIFFALGLSLVLGVGAAAALSSIKEEVKPTEAVSSTALYFVNNTGDTATDWYFHHWGGSDDSTWPGEQMSKTTDGLYEIPMAGWADCTGFIINNGGDSWKTKNMEKSWYSSVDGDLFYYVEDDGHSLSVTTRHEYKYSVDGGAH